MLHHLILLTFLAQTLPGMPPVIDPRNVYSEAAAGRLSPATAGALSRVYVPNVKSGDVYVIDPSTFQVVDRFVGVVNKDKLTASLKAQVG